MILIAKTNFDLTRTYEVLEEYTSFERSVVGQNNLNTTIKTFNNSRDIYLTFMSVATDGIIRDIAAVLNLSISVFSVDPLIITLTGNLKQWKESIEKACNLEGKPQLNKIFSQAYSIIKNSEKLDIFNPTVSKGTQLKFLE